MLQAESLLLCLFKLITFGRSCFGANTLTHTLPSAFSPATKESGKRIAIQREARQLVPSPFAGSSSTQTVASIFLVTDRSTSTAAIIHRRKYRSRPSERSEERKEKRRQQVGYSAAEERNTGDNGASQIFSIHSKEKRKENHPTPLTPSSQ